ncbi:oligoendopeptidase F [Caldanaerobacter subterraneus subsp. tengcongensis MB4]|uniref:Oligopeptidase F n=2 Tax=Caldanaerobacter subterraneus TaxID=911092 RepID=Q8R6T0_CALS4|nr:oligoendopeptidase F [Caldanaerobacter subterraneus]AAM25823.1 Oligoendopeptidase F [Caldanaerobacter subterraneus subsp. tengcongensis MB4]KKC28566.1 oligoendopeptidase F [Caldanaerobacter subterraneus subsp. pacificus DSM 12653]MCS3917306.1 oligoendopeptidase F [Caldanaerobacter subterraneus subsp. tengcongensis MB4]
MSTHLLERKDVDERLTWDLSGIFKTEEDYEEAVKKAKDLADEIEKEFKGHLNTPENINRCLDKYRKLAEILTLAGNYAFLSVAVDQTNTYYLERQSKFRSIAAEIESRLSFIESEIIQQEEEVINKAIEGSKENANYLKEILRKKKHALHPEVEKALSALSPVLDVFDDIYNMAKLADMDFGTFKVEDKEYPLSFSLFETKWEYEKDTKIRRAAFEAFYKKLKEYQNTIAAVYHAQVQKEKIIANLRGFDSVFDSLLFPQKVEREMYERQIDLIMEHLAPHMRKFAKLLQRIHGLEEMTFADLKLEVDPDFEPEVTIEEAKNYIQEGLSVLGEDYREMLRRAFDERWIDFAANKGKSTGAFCATPYGAHPYVLINWADKMREVFVLAHELGHAGHFYLAHQYQNIFDSRPSLYFIEAPSTMNELLMANYLMKKNSSDKRMKRWVLSTLVSRTYYHNFVTHLLEAAYQREVYRVIDKGGSITAQTLNRIKREVLEKFWGDVVKINEGAELTWMRQPHYYMGLYPYTYSAGLTIATQVNKRYLQEGQKALEDWKEVLKAGGTKTPLELAQMAGVDMTTEKPLLDTIQYIGDMIDEIIQLTEELEG